MIDGLLRFLKLKSREADYTVEVRTDGGAYIMDGDRIVAGPYQRVGDAKGQLTRLRSQYTAAARRPR